MKYCIGFAVEVEALKAVEVSVEVKALNGSELSEVSELKAVEMLLTGHRFTAVLAV